MKMIAMVLTILVGCQAVAGSEPKPNKEPPPAKRFEHDMLVRFHMHENFGVLRAIERLLVHGKLDDGRSLARAIAEAPDEPGLEAFARRTTEVRLQAAAVAQAATLDGALRAEARLARACAGCHADAGVLPEFADPPPIPADTGTVQTRMARHLWATDRLWESMVGDNDESWRSGLDVLASAPLPAAELGSERAALARQFQRLADQARRTDDRARAYGEILVTCAACHAAPSRETP